MSAVVFPWRKQTGVESYQQSGEAAVLRDDAGQPTLAFIQVSRNTFIELGRASDARPAGLTHFGLEVDDLEAATAELRRRGVEIGDPRVGRTISFITSTTDATGVRMELSEIGPDSMLGKAIARWKVARLGFATTLLGLISRRRPDSQLDDIRFMASQSLPLLFSAVLFFQVVTLPVDLDATARAKKLVVAYGIISEREREGMDRVLNAAALTYVATVVSTLLTLLYFLMRAGFLGGGTTNGYVPTHDRSGRRQWSAAIRCQNRGDGVRFRASHW